MRRREFMNGGLQTSIGLGVGLTILKESGTAFGSAANNKINIGLIGCGGRGRQLLEGFLERTDIAVLHCCDPQRERAEKAVKLVAESRLKFSPPVSSNMRTVLDDPAVDAVVCATPDHWHALGSIWACQAEKDVYTEKPASHSAWEGQKMVEAARKYKRIVQLGTQNRSAPYNIAAKKYIQEGKLGKVHFCRVHNMKGMPNVKLAPTCPEPPGYVWDQWLGPAPYRPFSPSYTAAWHELWDFSSGDLINDGIHQLDLARWLVGKDMPKSVYCVGGRFDRSGDAEAPDVQTVTYEFDDLMLNYEQTSYTPYMLKTDPVVRESDMFPYWLQNASRIEIFGSEGIMLAGRHGGGWEVFGRPKDRKPVVKDSMYGRFPDPEHKENFLQCVRTRTLPNADIETGHRSTLWGHFATISLRLNGTKLLIDPVEGTILDNPAAAKFYKREYRSPYVVPEEV